MSIAPPAEMSTESLYVPMSFISPTELYDTVKPYTISTDVENWAGSVRRSNFQKNVCNVMIHNLRGREADFSFEENGFAVIDLKSSMSYEDFADPTKLADVYVQEVGSCLLDYFGATALQAFSVIVFPVPPLCDDMTTCGILTNFHVGASPPP